MIQCDVVWRGFLDNLFAMTFDILLFGFFQILRGSAEKFYFF